jgi:ATP-dependent DNA helicase PIF1
MTRLPLIPEQQTIVDMLNSEEGHFFITGKAGSGKTHVLRAFQQLTQKKIAICAPTGIAAINAGGSTIHQLVGLGTGIPSDGTVDKYKIKSKKRKALEDLDTIVIDEVSMVSSEMMDATDRMLQYIREDSAPFGGLQIVMFGDVYQLPPVAPPALVEYLEAWNYKSEWFFDAKVWEDVEFESFELQTIHRQSDAHFKTLLNGVRDGTITQPELNQLNLVGMRQGKSKDSILLGARRKAVEFRNDTELQKLRSPLYTYDARVNTGYGRDEPADRVLRLKKGAKVMMLTNDREDRWVNGTHGTIADLSASTVSVEIDGMVHTVERYAWVPGGTHPEDYVAAPKYHQLPVKLAWGVTIHKSQGLSLDEIEVDLGHSGAFSAGQTYVALSRVKTPEGLFIKTPLRMNDIQVDKNVQRFFKTVKTSF